MPIKSFPIFVSSTFLSQSLMLVFGYGDCLHLHIKMEIIFVMPSFMEIIMAIRDSKLIFKYNIIFKNRDLLSNIIKVLCNEIQIFK